MTPEVEASADGPIRRPLLVVLAVAAVVTALDQVTKTLALQALADGPVELFWTLRLQLSFNTGISFSLGSGATPLITVAAIVLVVVMLTFARSATTPAVAAALGLVVGGAVGNLSDRLFRGHRGAVVDFIDFQWWPVFNVADMAISTGAVLLVVLTFVQERRSTRVDEDA